MRQSVLILLLFGIFAAAGFSQSPMVRDGFDEATRAANRQDFANALSKYRQTLILAEDEKAGNEFLAKIHFNLGVCLYHSERSAEAVGELKKALALTAGNYQKAFYVIGMAQFDLQNFRESKEAFLGALKLDKKDGETWFDLAMLFLREKDFEAAENAFAKAVKYKSVAAADARNNLGVIFALRHDFAAAEKQFEVAAKTSVEARRNLQFCKIYKERNFREAIAELNFSQQPKSTN